MAKFRVAVLARVYKTFEVEAENEYQAAENVTDWFGGQENKAKLIANELDGYNSQEDWDVQPIGDSPK